MLINTKRFHFQGFSYEGDFSIGLGQKHPRDPERRTFHYTYQGWGRGFWIEVGSHT